MGRSRSRSRSRERRREGYDRQERGRDRSAEAGRHERSRELQRGADDERRRSPDRRDRRAESRSPGRGGYRRDRSSERMPPPRSDGPPPPRRGPGPCFKCGEEGHIARDCPDAPPEEPRACYNCGQEGHLSRDCPNPKVEGAGPRRARGGGDDEANMKWGKGEDEEEEEVPEKEPEPDFGLSGTLAAETNKVNGVVLLHQEPAEARKPSARWRLYVFKGGEPFGEPLHIHRQSSYLFGRERRVVDVPTDHPSCSKQHAVLQYRLTEKEGKDGMMKATVRPYMMDLGSTNGTYLNGERLEAERYYELLEKDMLRFGNSSREYILLSEK